MRKWLVLLGWLVTSTAAWAQVSLVPAGTTWKFLDTGTSPATTWRTSAFDDTLWRSGPAKLGYGQGNEVTTVGFGPNANNKFITTYFRRGFTVADPAAYASLSLRVRRDDGVVVYVNGSEVYRNNLPAGALTASTLASTAAADGGTTWLTTTVAPTVLVAGANVVAAEIHQAAVTSSDIAFDLSLSAATAGSTPVPPAAASLTRGPYLQAGTATGVTLRWRTSVATDSTVRWGLTPDALVNAIGDAALTTEHVVKLSALSPDTRYFYAVGSSTATLAGADANHHFVTSPPPGAARATRVWVIGDAGTGTAQQRAVRDAYAAFAGNAQTHLWLQLGDNAYLNGTDAEFQANLFNVYGDLLRRSVTWPALGNHDTGQVTNPPASLPYYQMFSPPTAGEAGGVPSGTRNYYAFDVGNIHFINLDSMVSSRLQGGAMLNWLQADLAANTRDWTIAYWHHPPYSKSTHDSDREIELIDMRQQVLPVLESFGVDLVLSGHSHAYERSYLIDGHYGASTTFTAAMKKNGGSGRPGETGAYTKPLGPSSHQGTVYAVVGASGGPETGGTLNHPAMFMSVAQSGSLVLDINGQQLDARYLGETGAVLDSFTIAKGGVPVVVNSPPTVQLTEPLGGSRYVAPATIALSANASDRDGSIQRVEFYRGSTLIGTATTAPYRVTWANAARGSYTLTARAYDNQGASTTSAPVSVTVTR